MNNELPEIKIWRINDYEWWAGKSLESIKPAYREFVGIDPDDVDEGFDNPHELSDEEMDTLTYVEDLASFPEGSITFRQRLAQLTEFPCFFAGTEF